MGKVIDVHFRTPEYKVDKLDEFCDKEGKTRSEVLRSMLDDFLDEKEAKKVG